MKIIFFTSRIKKQEDIAYDKEVQAFVDMVTTVRSQYKHNVEKTNMGLIISPKIKSTYPAKTSIKVIVRYDRCLTKENMVTFTCDVSTSVVHIIFTVIAELPGTIFLTVILHLGPRNCFIYFFQFLFGLLFPLFYLDFCSPFLIRFLFLF